ncbi:MAG: urate hydroxylase PuuD, partial [Pseudobdellovibrionaceae bacterium]
MSSPLFSLDGLQFILRWLHFFFGVMWIGHLYYFNFVQGATMAEADAATKSGIQRILLPKAMWWFRWGAMWTMVTGLLMLMIKGHQAGPEVFSSSWGITILIGTVLGLTMWANVWFIIWPAQKIVIASATQVAAGGAALPEAAAAGPRGLLASRTNTLMSIPMLFFMGAASHLPIVVTPESSIGGMAAVLIVLWLVLEGNAIKGKLGPMQTVKG